MMPSNLETLLLTVDARVIDNLFTDNDRNFHAAWRLFSRCAGFIEEGRRLENLSWRSWNRETLCCKPGKANITTPAIPKSQSCNSQGGCDSDFPDLSGSACSVANGDAIGTSEGNVIPPDTMIPRKLRRISGFCRFRGYESHIASCNFQKMVVVIQEKRALKPLSPTIQSYLELHETRISVLKGGHIAAPAKESPSFTEAESTVSLSTTPISSQVASGFVCTDSERSATSFVPSFLPSSNTNLSRSNAPLSMPPFLTNGATATGSSSPTDTMKEAMFALQRSCHSRDHSFNKPSEIKARVEQGDKVVTKVFHFGGSSGEGKIFFNGKMKTSRRSSPSDVLRQALRNKKQTSFKPDGVPCTILEDRARDDDEIINSGFIDADRSNWGNLLHADIDEKLSFQRVNSRPNPTSRRSLITIMLHQNDSAKALAEVAAEFSPVKHGFGTSSHNGPSLAAALESDDAALPKIGKRPPAFEEIPRATFREILETATNTTRYQAALLPKLARGQIPAKVLRATTAHHPLRQRQPHNRIAFPRFECRQDANDLANLKQHPEKILRTEHDKIDLSRCNQYFFQGLGDYHSRGW